MGDLVWEAFLSKVTFELCFHLEIIELVFSGDAPSTDIPAVR